MAVNTLNEARFKNTVLAILKTHPGLGSVQVRKSLIIADALRNALFGESLTGARYIKDRYGPVPDRNAFNLLNKMYIEEFLIDIIEEADGHYTKNSYFALKDPDPFVFNEEEDKIIRFAADIALKYSATLLSSMTHDDTYNNTPMGEEIPLDRVCTMTLTGPFDTPSFTKDEKINLIKVLDSDAIQQYTFV